MNLHEYQSKQLFADYGMPVSRGIVVDTPDEAVAAARNIGGGRWVCKVQVHAGGRGKAGGVKVVDSLEAVKKFAQMWIGERLVTVQTDTSGQPVSKIYIEECVDIATEFYLGAVIDRSSQRVVIMASTEGGVEIEKVAHEAPEKILRATIDPLVGAQRNEAREMAVKLGLDGIQIEEFSNIYMHLAYLFHELDCSLVEVNPLVLTEKGNIHCLDAKINIDNNALFRHPTLKVMRDSSQGDIRETQAGEFGLNYVALDGNIGCMVNGAGLAMGTMDLVKLCGGNPANFLDVGGSATKQAVSEAFRIILSDSNVRAVLINIFGGIVSCATIAEGIIGAVTEVGVDVPVVVRFEGNNALLGTEQLKKSGLDLIPAESLEDAAKKVVVAAGNFA